MAKLLITTTSIVDGVVDDEKPIPDVADAEFDKETYEEKFVADVVVVLESKTSELEDVKETKFGEGTKLRKGEGQFLEKDGSLVAMDANKNELRVVEVIKGVVDGKLGGLETTVGKMTTEDVMAATTMVSNIELEATKMVQGGESDEVEFAENDWKSGCLALVEASNMKEEAIVALETTKDQVEAVGMEVSELVEGDLEPREQDAIDWQLESLEDKHDDMVVAVSQVESIKVSVAKDDNDVVFKGQDDVFAAHMMKPRIEQPHLETPEVLEDEVAILLCGVDEKHGGIDPAKVMIAIGGEFTTNSQSLVEGEIVIKNAPQVQTMDTNLGEVGEVRATLEENDSGPKTAVCTKLDRFGEIDATLSELCIAAATIVRGEFNEDGVETRVAESYRKDTCLDSSDVLVEADIVLDRGEKNCDVMEIKYDEVVLAEEGEMLNVSRPTLESEFVEDDTTSVSIDVTKFELEATFGKEEGIDATLEQEHSQVVTLVVMDAQDGLIAVKDKPIKESTTLATPDILEKEVKLTTSEEIKIDAPHGPMDSEVTLSAEQPSVKDWKTIVMGDFFDEDVSLLSLHESKSMVEASLGEVDKTDATFEAKDTQTLTEDYGEAVQDVMVAPMVEQSMEHPCMVVQHVPKEKASITLGREDEKDDDIGLKFLEVVDITGGELVVDSRATIEDEFVIEDAPLVSLHSLDIDLDPTIEEEEIRPTLVEKDSEKTNTIDPKLYEVDWLDATLVQCAASVRVEGKFGQDANEVVLGKLLASPNATDVELVIAPDNVKGIGATMEQEDSQGVIADVTMEDESMLPTRMGLVNDWHISQEGNMFIECTSLVSLSGPQCEVDAILGEVDGMNAKSKDTSTLPEADQEVTQDVLAAHMMATTSSEVDTAFGEFDEIDATFETKDSQTLTYVAVEDTQDVSVTCAKAPSMGSPYLVTRDVLEVEVPMMLGEEEEKDTSMEPNIDGVVVEDGGKSAMELHVSTKGEFVVQADAPFLPVQAQEIHLDASLDEVEETTATLEAKESDQSMDVVNTKLDQPQEVDATLVELRGTTTTTVKGEFTQDVSVIVLPEASKKDTCYESPNMLEEAELELVQEDKKYDTIEAMFEDVVPTVEGELQKELQGKLDNEFVIEDAPLVSIHSAEIDLNPTLEEEEEIRASLVENSEVTTAIDTKLDELDMIDTTLVECAATTRVEADFAQDGLEKTVAESSRKDEFVDYSNVMEEMETTSCQKDENYDAMKSKFEKAVLAEEGKLVNDSVEVFDSEFVKDNLLVSLDASGVELVILPDDVREIGATMEQEDSQVVKPQGGITIAEVASIEGSTSSSTQNVLQSEDKLALCEGVEKHAPDVTMEDESMLPTRMGFVKDWHVAQEGDMFIECASSVSLSAPQCEVDAILGEVDGMSAKSKDTSTLPEADQEVTQDVLAAHVMATTSSEFDTAFGEFDEIGVTFETKDSQTLTHVAVEDTQDVSVACARAPSMGSPYLVTRDVLEVEVPMMLHEEEEKGTSVEPNIDGVLVEDGGKSAMELHVSTKGEFVMEDDAPFLPVHAEEIHLDASLDEVEETTATLEAKESDQAMDVVNTKLDQQQEVDATLVVLRGTTTTTVEGEFTQDVSVVVLPEASKTYTCCESPDMLEEAELVLVQEGKKYDTIEAKFEDVVPTVEGELQKDLEGKLDDEFVKEDAPLVSIHSAEIDLDPTLGEEEEIRSSLVGNSEVTTAIDTKLDELDMIDATLVECAATTRVEADFAQDGLENTVAESSWIDEFVDYSNVMEEMETTSCQKDENYDAVKSKFEKALLAEEGKQVNDSVEVFNSEFVKDNLLVSLDASGVELVIPPDDVREIGATMEQEDSQVVKPQGGITIVEVASIEGSTSSSTHNVLQSEDKLALCEGVEKQAPDVTMEDESMLPTRMGFVKDWHVAQEGDMFIECASSVSLSAPQCEFDAILGEVDGMSAKSKDTSTLPEVDQEVTQDVLATHVMATTSSEFDTVFAEFDEIGATFETKDSQTLTHVAVEDTQDVSVACARAPIMGSPYLVTCDVLEVEVPMMLGEEEEKHTSTEPDIDGAVVEDGGKSAMELHVSTTGEFVVEDDAPFLPVHAQQIHLDASLDEVEETIATLEAKESDQSMDVVKTKLDQPQEEDVALVELRGTTTTTVEGEFTQDVSVVVLPEASKKDTCFESPDMLEEADLVLVQEDKKYGTIEAKFEDVVPTVEGELQKDLQGKLDDEFVKEDAPLVSIHSAEIDLDPTLGEEEEIRASLVENSEVTTPIDTKLDELDMIDATQVECAATTRFEADFAQDGLEKTVSESSRKDEFEDYSNVMEEMETTSCQKDENYGAIKSKFEKALLAEEGELVNDSVEVFDSEFVMDNLLASPDATGVELVIPPDDVRQIGATIEQEDSQVVKPQRGSTIAEVASIEGSTSLSTQNVIQSEDKLALCESVEKHAPDVTMEDASMLPTRMGFVKDWHVAQEGDMFIECTSSVSLSAPQCEVDAILGEVDGMSAKSKDTSTLPEVDQEVTQDVLAAHVMATTSSEFDTVFGEFDEIGATFETKDSQILTHEAVEDTQDVSVTCARAPIMGSPYLVTSMEPNIEGAVVEDGGKSAMELHVSTKGEFVVEDDAPFLPVHAQQIHLDASLDEVEVTTATLEAKESDQSMDVVKTKLDQPQEEDVALVELRGTTTTTVEGEFTQDVSVVVLPEASKKYTCFESPDMPEEAELVLVQEDKKYETIEDKFEDVVPTVEGELQKDLQGKLDDEFVKEDAQLVSIHSAEINLDPTIGEEEEIRASLVENSEVTTPIDTKLDELDMIDATQVECAATNRFEADFAQDGLEKTVSESSRKDEFVDYSNVMEEMETTSCQKDENYDAIKSKFEKALLAEEGKLVNDSVEVFDSEFVMDNLLASPDATSVELVIPPDDVRQIGATMEQEDSQVVKPQGGSTIAEVASIEGSTSLSTQNVLQSEDKLALCEGVEKHAPDVTMEDESMLPTRMGFVKDWHVAQEGDMFIECASSVSLSAPHCEVDAILDEVDGMSAKSKDTSTLPEADQEVTQDVSAAHVMATTSSEFDTAFGEFDEIGVTFETKDSQTLTHVAVEDTQDVLVACARAPSMGSPYLVTRDVLEVEVPMMLDEEEEKGTSVEPNIDGVVVEDGGKSAMELHVSTKGEFVGEDDTPFLPVHAQQIHLDASLDEVEETTATLEEKESDQPMDVVDTKLDQPQEVDATLVELRGTTTTTVEGEFTQVLSVIVLPETSKKDRCFESLDMLEEAELVLVQEDKKYDTIEAMFEDVVPTVEGELQKDLQVKLDDEFVVEDAPLVSIHSAEIDLDPTLGEEEEIWASLVENSEVTTAIDTKLDELDLIDATLVECAATTRVEADYAQDGLEKTVADSSWKDEFVDYSNVVEEMETTSCQKDENYDAIKSKFEKALLAEEGKLVNDSVEVFDSEFVMDNLLASPDATSVELVIPPDDVRQIGATMEQEDSQVVKPQGGTTIAEVASIEGSTSLSTQNVLQSEDKLALCEGVEKHAPDVTMEDASMLPTRMGFVKDWHVAQEGDMFIQCTSSVSLIAPQCEVDAILCEVDGMSAESKDTSTLPEADQEVTQDVLAAQVMATTSSEVDTAFGEFDEIDATFEIKDSQTLTHVAVEDNQDVSVTCAREPSMGSPYLVTRDVLEVEVPMMLGEEEEKDTSMEPNIDGVVVEDGGKSAMELHVSTKGKFVVEDDAPFLPVHAQEIHLDASLDEVVESTATLEAKESDQSMDVVNTKLDQPQEVDATLVELRGTTTTTVEGEFTQDVSVVVLPEASKKDTCFESPDMLEEAEVVLVQEDKKYDTIETMFEDVVPTVEGELQKDLQGKLDDEFVIEDAPLVSIHSAEIDLDPTLTEEEEIRASLVENSEVTTAIDTKLDELDMIDATLVECAATTRVEVDFAQDGLEKTVAESSWKDEFVDYSNVMEEMETTSCQKDENYDAIKSKFEKALLAEEGKQVKDSVEVFDSEFVMDNLLVSLGATGVELGIPPDDVRGIGATMEKEDSQVVKPQGGIPIAEVASIEGSTSSSIQNVLQSEDKITPCEGVEKQAPDVTMEDESMLPTRMAFVNDWHMAQEGNMFIECTSLVPLSAPQCEVDAILGEVDGMSAKSKDTSTLPEADQEVTQDVLVAHVMATASSEVDTTFGEFDEIDTTFETKDSQTLTHLAVEDSPDVAVEDTQDVSVTCARAPSMGSPYLVTRDVLEVEFPMMLGEEEEKDTSMLPNIDGVVVEDGGKSAMELHVSTKGEFIGEDDTPFLPVHAQEIHLDASLDEVEETIATLEAKESDQSMDVVNTKLDQQQEVDATLVELRGTTTTTVEGEFTQDVSVIVLPETSKKDRCFESLDMLEEAELVLIQEDKKYDTIEAMFEDVVPTVEGELQKDLQGKLDDEFVIEDASLVSIHSAEIDLDPTLEEEEEIQASLVENSEVITTIDTKLDELDMIDATLVECAATTRVEADFAQDGLEKTVAESSWKDKFVEYSNVMVEMETTSCQKDENYDAMNSKFEKVLLAEKGKLVNDSVEVFDREFVMDNLLVSPDATGVELVIPPDDVREIGATMEQEDSQVVKPQGVIIIAEVASIEGSTSSSTRNVLQSEDKLALCEGLKEHAPDVTMENESMLSTRVGFVKDWHVAQEGDMFIECTSLVSLSAPQCEVDAILGEVDGMSDKSKDTSTLPDAEQEVTQDVLAAHVMVTTSCVVDTVFGEFDEIDATFETKDSQTLTHIAVEDTQDVSVTCARAPSVGSPYLVTRDVLDVGVPMMLGEEEEKDTSMEPNIDGVVVKDGGKSAMELDVSTKGQFVVEDAPFLPLHAQEIHLDGSLDDEFVIEDAPLVSIHSPEIDLDPTLEEEKEIRASLVENCEVTTAIDTKLYEVDRIDATLVECAATTRVEGEFAQDGLEMTMAESSRKDEYMDSSDIVIQAEIISGQKDENFDVMKTKYEKALLVEEGKMVKDSVVAVDSEFVVDNLLASLDTVKEQPLSFDVIMDGNTGCDDIVVISYNDEICDGCGETAEEDGRVSSDESPAQVAILDSSDCSIQIIKDSKDDDNNDDWDEEGLGSVALASHLKPRTCTSLGGNITVTSQDTSIFSADLPAGLGSSTLSLRPTTTLPSSRSSISSPSEPETTPNPIEAMTEDEKKLHEKLELIRVKFLHLVCRMGATPEESVAAQVLYHLSLAEGIRRGQASSLETLESAWNKVLQQEAESREDLSFSCNILVLGKTGVGKSATINSIFGEEKSKTDAFDASTTNVREISGSVDGVQVHIIDTPGLRTNGTNQGWNKKVLSAIKSYTKKCPPDMILYVDRLDSWSRDDDLPLLRTITATFGTSIWLNVIVTLTHAASAPPDSSNGDPVTYETLIAQRSHIIQQSVRQAASDMRLMNPVALVENHPYCRRNRQGQMVLPNGQAWRNQLLLLCYSTKILSEANSLLKLQDPSPREYSCFGFRSVPLPFLLSSLLQPRSHPKLSADHGGDEDDSDVDLDDYSDICDDEGEYDRLPTCRPLTKVQFHKLTKDLDEYDYWVKLLQKKQWKGGLQRLKEMKKRGKAEQDSYGYGNMAGENDRDVPLENIAVPSPDMVLPPSFDSDDPTYRYRFLKPTSTIVSRPVLDVHSWDHDCGFDGVSLEDTLAIAREFPAAVSVQLTKDKKELTIHLDSSISRKHGENASSLAGFDVQSVRRQLAYGLWGETKFKNIKKNKTTGGFSVTFLDDTMATGVKVEDQLSVGKSLSLVASTGAMRAQGDTAYGANLEARLKDKDYPINQFMLFLGLSLMKWRGDLAFGANMQSQFSVGRGSKMALHIGLNNKLSGQINVKMSTSEQVQMALLGLVPLAASIYKSFRPAEA